MDSTRDSLFEQLDHYHTTLEGSNQLREYLKSRWEGKVSSYDRAGQILRYLHLLSDDNKAEWDSKGFAEGLKFTLNPSQEDSLVFYLMLTNLERESYPFSPGVAESWCPAKFARAKNDLWKEINEEWDYTLTAMSPTRP